MINTKRHYKYPLNGAIVIITIAQATIHNIQYIFME